MDIIARALAAKAFEASMNNVTNEAKLTVLNTSNFLSKTITKGNDCYINFTWSSIENGMSTGNGTAKITVNNLVKKTLSISQGEIEINLNTYLSSGENIVKIIVSDVYNNTKTLSFTISVVDLLITSTFEDTVAYTGDIRYTYTPIGNVEKTVHFIVDGEEIGTEIILVSGRQQTYTISELTHGSHSLEVYYSATINNEEVESNRLYYELICIEEDNNTPIIASNFNVTSVKQHNNVSVEYIVYTPNSYTSNIELYANDTLVNSISVDRTRQIWTYQPDETGELILSIVCGTVSKSFELEVIETDINVEAETNDLVLYLSSQGRSNGEEHPENWGYEDIEAILTDFNFVSDGWQRDNDGISVLKISGDARVEIPFKIFENDFRTTGKTIEFEFSTTDIIDYDTTILSCMNGGRGIELTPQKATFTSEQTSISTQYKEDEHVRISFVVEKRNENRLVYCYINGIISGLVQYPDDNDFSQITPANITIGSSDCTTNIYCIRIYDNDLTRYQIVDNWIADTQQETLKAERYIENNIYDDYGNIVISKLPEYLPYLVLEGAILPTYKGDKRTVGGYYVNPTDESKSFSFTNATIDVQGTSSQYYARKNYKIKFKNFTMTSTGETTTTYALRNNSIPVSTFTFKADVASSEGANNVELVRLYNNLCPYHTPPQEENGEIRQGIDGFPIVVFWNNGEDTTFLGKYNFNNDKGTDATYGFSEGDESWETLDNTLNVTQFKSVPSISNKSAWLSGFEARYPEDNEDLTNLHALATWINSTDTAAATDVALDGSVTYGDNTYTTDSEEYRLAKFRYELEDYLNVDDTIFYYVFTELFLMIDSRVKNSFPTKFGDNTWCWLPYDMDTAIGINNEGTLAFDYSLEDIDHTSSGADIFNGQDSVLWNNLREAFPEEIKSMYQTLRSNGLSYSAVENQYEQHQSYWSASIFNEDAYFKYIQPLIDNGEDYLLMCQGSKAEQRKWWLWNRFRYIDSKYNTGDAQSSYINFRAYANSDFYITPYADIYIRVKCGSYETSVRANKNQEYHLALDRENANDTETMIFSADQLKDVGDLSGFKVGFCNIAAATRLEHLKIGSEDEENLNLTNLTLGNNTLLKTIDVRNCPNLTQTINASGCSNIEELYFEGSGITGVTLPNGGVVNTLHLPDTITNLTIRNQTMIEDFELEDSSNITTLRLENVSSAVPIVDIFNDIASGSRVRLIGLDLDFENMTDLDAFLNKLDAMRGLDENGNNTATAQVQGTITITDISDTALEKINTKYTNLQVNYTNVWYTVNFYMDDGETLLQSYVVRKNETVTYSVTPTKASTAQYSYSFAGWSLTINGEIITPSTILTNVVASVNLYAKFTSTVRTYTVRFYDGDALLETKALIPYGDSVDYSNYVTKKGYRFLGFVPDGSNIQGDTDCYAQFEEITTTTGKLLSHALTGTFSSNDITRIITRPFINYSQYQNLTEIYLPNCTYVNVSTFNHCRSVISITTGSGLAGVYFGGCTNLQTLVLTEQPSIADDCCKGCTHLTLVDLRACTSVPTNNSSSNNSPFESATYFLFTDDVYDLMMALPSSNRWYKYRTKFIRESDYAEE